MMEVVGAIASGITVAHLARLSIDAFDAIQVARKQGLDYEKLSLRLGIERARLYIWAQTMGLAGCRSDRTTHLLEDSPY